MHQTKKQLNHIVASHHKVMFFCFSFSVPSNVIRSLFREIPNFSNLSIILFLLAMHANGLHLSNSFEPGTAFKTLHHSSITSSLILARVLKDPKTTPDDGADAATNVIADDEDEDEDEDADDDDEASIFCKCIVAGPC
jgi:hypothetical protein